MKSHPYPASRPRRGRPHAVPAAATTGAATTFQYTLRVLPTLRAAFDLSSAAGINDNGWIVGDANVPGSTAVANASPLVQVLWKGLEHREIDPVTAMREIEAGLPGGPVALVAFTRHPRPAVRLAAAGILARRAREPAPLQFTLLGGFSLTRDSQRADDSAWERRVAQRVVRFLLVHRGRAVSEDELLEAFWPDRHVNGARRSLHVAISRARHVLDVPGVASVIEIAERTYTLRLRPSDRVDADAFDAAATAALAEKAQPRAKRLERAASLWGGEPLPEERYSDWALAWRERLTDLYAAVLGALCDDRLDAGDLIVAALRARDLVELDPLNEGGHRRLMVAYARGGQRSQALRQFLECRRALTEQIGVEPAVETARLQERVLAGEPV